MSELRDIAATFSKSKPVFKIVYDGSRGINFTLKEKYSPPVVDDPVYSLVKENFTEILNRDARDFESNINLQGIFNSIVETVKQVYINTSPLKNPKQSKTYKWLYDFHMVRYDSASAVGFIGLYRYIMNNNIEDTRDKTNPHAKNVLAVLEVMKDKHEG